MTPTKRNVSPGRGRGSGLSTNTNASIAATAAATTTTTGAGFVSGMKLVTTPVITVNAANTTTDNHIVRPTEAQLRWAQFHHKRRAVAVREKIERMYQSGDNKMNSGNSSNTDEVDDDDDDDLDDTSGSGTTLIREIRHRRRPEISDERRAMLKRSRRQYRKRRQSILKHGYREGFSDNSDNSSDGDGGSDDNMDRSDDSAAGQHETKKSRSVSSTFQPKFKGPSLNVDAKEKDITFSTSASFVNHATGSQSDDAEDDDDYTDNVEEENDNDDEAALDEIFMSRPKRQRRRRHRTEQDKESFKRFQAACHAMMMNVKTASAAAKTPMVVNPTTKRWTRSEQHIAAAESMMNVDYLDYRWGIRRKGKNEHKSFSSILAAYYSRDMTPMDRGASWLMHASKHVEYYRDTPYYHDVSELPPGSACSAGDNGSESNLSSSTLAMRTPGPKKFHQLVSFVQQRLIEKERLQRQDQEKKLSPEELHTTVPKMRLREPHFEDDGADPAKSATSTSAIRTMAEQLESKNNGGPNRASGRIRQMARSLEGDHTPKMKLKDDAEFFGSDQKNPSCGRSQRRRSRYIPRMRLREFKTFGEGKGNNHEQAIQDDTDDHENPQTPRMKLAHTFHRVIGPDETTVTNDAPQINAPMMKLNEFTVRSPEKLADKDEFSKLKVTQSAVSSQKGEVNIKLKGRERPQSEGTELSEDYDIEEKKEPEPFGVSRSMEKDKNKTHSSLQSDPSKSFRNIKSGSARVSAFFGAAQTHHDNNHRELEATPTTGDTTEEAPMSARESPASVDATPLASNKNTKSNSFLVQHLNSNAEQEEPGPSPNRSEHSSASNLSGFWKQQGNGSNILSNAFSSGLHAIAESSGEANNHIASFITPEIKARASDVSGRVSGIFNKLRGIEETSDKGTASQGRLSEGNSEKRSEDHNTSDHDPYEPHVLLHVPSGDSHAALAAYHKKRASMTRDDDQQSSASSSRPLPAEIREAVQNSSSYPRIQSNVPTGPSKESHNDSSQVDDGSKKHLRTPRDLKDALNNTHTKYIDATVPMSDFDPDSVIDTDETQSDASPSGGINPKMLAGLMMSPDVLQKRLGQAIRAVEEQKWDHVQYLINANPWLSEMKELTTNQYLLHKVSYFGSGRDPAPDSLVEDIIKKFPSAVYKFDEDGNVPLHLAAASKNLSMINMLGEKFEGGASIRNEDGFLPLHFAIAAYSNIDDDVPNLEKKKQESLHVVEAVLKFFPQAVAIADNDGNLPLHVAAECLDGGEGVDVIYVLMDEAERQMEDPDGARFRNKLKLENITSDDMSMATISTERETDSSILDDNTHCTMIVNDFNETPLHVAIRSRKGWEIIEAILSGKGGRRAALHEDAEKNNALHLLVGQYQDATAAMSILKVAPESARGRNGNGVLPIEVACMHSMPEEVILSIALVDLPINIDDRNDVKAHDGQGGSWSFLTCESDDHFVSMVEEIVSICSFQQIRELCYMKDSSGNSVITRATPQCRRVLVTALRYMGRFELVGNGPVVEDAGNGQKIFYALDFGDDRFPEGKYVLLECFESEVDFEKRVRNMLHIELDDMFVEEVNVFVEYIEDTDNNAETALLQRCVSIERPKMTLDKVVAGMMKSGGYEGDPRTRKKYTAKMCSVLRLIAKAIRHLHDAGAIHGNISMRSCCKFDESWKLGERLSVQIIDEPFDNNRFLESFPPEAVEFCEQDGTVFDSDNTSVRFKALTAKKSIDIWAFGKLAFECLVGKPLVAFDSSQNGEDNAKDSVSMLEIMEWDHNNMQEVFSNLLDSGLGESGADLITSCLFPHPDDRPSNMDEILSHEFWQEMKHYRSKRRSSTRKKRESRSVDGSSSISSPRPQEFEI